MFTPAAKAALLRSRVRPLLYVSYSGSPARGYRGEIDEGGNVMPGEYEAVIPVVNGPVLVSTASLTPQRLTNVLHGKVEVEIDIQARNAMILDCGTVMAEPLADLRAKTRTVTCKTFDGK